jgi:CRISPR-associated protein Cmr6
VVRIVMLIDKLYSLTGNYLENLRKIAAEVSIPSLIAFSALQLLYSSVARLRDYKLGEVKKEVAAKLAGFLADLRYVKSYTEEVGNALRSNGYGVKVCEVRSEWRSIVGSSEPELHIPFEVGLFWDPVFNVPFIPGTSIKGAVRSAFRELLARDLMSSNIPVNEIRERVEEEAERVFGAGGVSAGLVGFTDAYPVSAEERLLEPDVVTPHYPGKRNELEAEPTPNVFVTIARGVTFRFYVFYVPRGDIPGRRKGGLRFAEKLDQSSGRSDLLLGNLADQWVDALGLNVVPLLDRAILYAFAKGVGAKTSVGYSRFAVVRYEEYRGS